MASTVDKNFQTRLFSFGTAAASEAPDSPEEQLRHSAGDERNLPARGVGRVGFLGIDLNVAPSEDGGYEFPVAESGGAWVSEVSSGNREEIGSHSSDCEITKISAVRQTEDANTAVTDSGNQNAEKMSDQEDPRWDALIEAARHALRDYGESARDKELKAQNRKRRPSREAQAGGGEPRRKIGGRGFAAGWDEFVAAPAVVVRSTRGRVVAMPNKYKDSVLHAAETVADFRFSRRRPRLNFFSISVPLKCPPPTTEPSSHPYQPPGRPPQATFSHIGLINLHTRAQQSAFQMSSPKHHRKIGSEKNRRGKLSEKASSFHGKDDIAAASILPRPRTVPDLLAGSRSGWRSAEYPAAKLTKLLLSVTIQRCLGAVRAVMPLEATVEDLIAAALMQYAREHRLPVLPSYDASYFDLHYSQFSLESLDRGEKLVALGSRNFFLCTKRAAESGGCISL